MSLSPDFTVNMLFIIWMLGIIAFLIIVLAIKSDRWLENNIPKTLGLALLSWLGLLLIFAPNILRLYKHKW